MSRSGVPVAGAGPVATGRAADAAGGIPSSALNRKVLPRPGSLSTAMLLRWFDQKKRNKRCRAAAGLIEHGIQGAMKAGVITQDLGGRATMSAFTKAVIKAIGEAPASVLK